MPLFPCNPLLFLLLPVSPRVVMQNSTRFPGPSRFVFRKAAPPLHYFRRASNILTINPTIITPETVYPKKLIQGIPNHCGIVRT